MRPARRARSLDQRTSSTPSSRSRPSSARRSCSTHASEIESELGRRAGGPRHGPRPIDIDILLLGGRRVRDRAAAHSAPEISRPGASCSSRCGAGPGPGRRRNEARRGSAASASRRLRDRPMLLAIDAGNTQTHIGMYKDDELVEHWRLHTDRDVTVDRIATELAGLLGLRGLRLRDIDGAIVSSVVPVLSHEYELLSERYLEGQLLMVGPPQDRHADPDGQPARGRCRPAGERARRVRAGRRPRASRWTSAPPSTTTSSRRRASTWAGCSRRAWRCRSTRSPSAPRGSSRWTSSAQVHDRALHASRAPVGWCTASPARWTGSSAASARSSARRPRRWPPAATRRIVAPHCESDRRGGRPADAEGPAADLGAQPP